MSAAVILANMVGRVQTKSTVIHAHVQQDTREITVRRVKWFTACFIVDENVLFGISSLFNKL